MRGCVCFARMGLRCRPRRSSTTMTKPLHTSNGSNVGLSANPPGMPTRLLATVPNPQQTWCSCWNAGNGSVNLNLLLSFKNLSQARKWLLAVGLDLGDLIVDGVKI